MKNKILFGLSLLFGLMFINSGLNKFFNYMPMPKDMPESMLKLMAAFMQISWLMPLVGFAEVLGGVLFIIPLCGASSPADQALIDRIVLQSVGDFAGRFLAAKGLPWASQILADRFQFNEGALPCAAE